MARRHESVKRMSSLLRPLGLATVLALLGVLGAASPVAVRSPDVLGEPVATLRYVALGDSYTAAPLVPPMSMAGGCLRSESNYPSLVAAAVPGTDLVDRSCSGADTGHLLSRQDTGEATVPPQLDAVTTATQLVTLGIGGNDFDLFGTLMGTCTYLRDRDPAGSPCRDAALRSEGDVNLAAVPGIRDHVAEAVREIRRRAPEARVLVVGYPQIVPPDGGCAALPFADGDVAYARMVNRRLVEAVEAAARRTGASYVDVWRASAGHHICADEPWVNGARTMFERALAYHPFAVEQQAVARLVLAELGLEP
jgi:lysophospholipase L1-like esterase